MGVLIHVLCDAANNLGVMAAALVIWLAKYDGRYYADPGVSMGIAVMIFLSSIPLSKSPSSQIFNTGLSLCVSSTENGRDPIGECADGRQYEGRATRSREGKD